MLFLLFTKSAAPGHFPPIPLVGPLGSVVVLMVEVVLWCWWLQLLVMSPHYFPISQAQDDLQQWIAGTDTSRPISATMLRRPEPTKENVELTIFSIIATDITHLTRFTLLLLLRILHYMWRNHVATCAQANNSDRNLDLNKIWFSYLHYILQYNFCIGFEFENLVSIYWYLEMKYKYEVLLCHDHGMQILY